MNSIQTFKSLVETETYKTVTTDIFDTVLLRKVWPEGRQFLMAAERSLYLFHEAISEDITAYEIFSWREHVRNEILNAKRQDKDADNDSDLTLDEWFHQLFTTLYAKHHAKSKKAPQRLIDELIAIEIELEKKLLFPNRKLIEAFREAKATNPKLKIFFLSDMYLTTSQVEELLRFHDILDIFDGGTTSVDIGNAKHSAKLFYHIQTDKKTFVDINLETNVHIGDSHHSDVAMAEIAGSKAVLYEEFRARKFRTLAGRIHLRAIKAKNRRTESKAYERAIKKSFPRKNSTERYFRDLGFLFAQPMATYLLHVGEMAKLVPNKHYLFVSSEASTFIEAGKHLYGGIYNKPEAAIKLNRKRTISAVVWKMIQQKDATVMPELLRTVSYGEVSGERKDIYDFLLTSDFPATRAELNVLKHNDFLAKLYKDLQSAEAKYTQHLKDCFDYVVSTLPKDNADVVICDVGWGGTVQAVYTIFADLMKYPGKIEGLYLGVHPPSRFHMAPIPMTGYLLQNVLNKKQRGYWSAVIWEYVYTNKFQFEGDEDRLTYVSAGLNDGYDYFRKTRLSPIEHFDHLAKKRIKRLLCHPTHAEVNALSQIHYDFGFNDPQILTIVNTTTPIWKFWAKTILKPKAALSEIVAPNNWTGGYIKHFRLFGARTVLRVIGRLKHTNYF